MHPALLSWQPVLEQRPLTRVTAAVPMSHLPLDPVSSSCKTRAKLLNPSPLHKQVNPSSWLVQV